MQPQDLNDLTDIEAEQMTLGALLKNPDVAHEVMRIVGELDFSHTHHIALFTNIKALYEQNKYDFNTLKQWLKEKDLLDHVGGLEYFGQLKFSNATSGLVKYYAEKVRDTAIKRRGLQLGQDIQSLTLSGQFETIEDYITAVSEKFNNLEITKKGNLVSLSKIIGPHIHNKLSGQRTHSPTTGLFDIDKWMKGIGRNRLIVVAGRPGAGKTALSLKIARNVAKQDYGPTAFFSCEMETVELVDRMLSDISGIPFSDIQYSNLDERAKSTILQSEGVMLDINMFIDDSSRMDINYIAGQCRKLKREHGSLGLVAIDYLGLLELNQKRGENKTDAIGRVTKECKNLAKELGCSVLLLAQMNREIDKRSTKRPVMSDLRDSGSIEQDADSVIFLHKDEEKSTALIAHIDFIVAKGRQTGMRDFELDFFGEIQRMTGKVKI
jgi:replicative DNA helicase